MSPSRRNNLELVHNSKGEIISYSKLFHLPFCTLRYCELNHHIVPINENHLSITLYFMFIVCGLHLDRIVQSRKLSQIMRLSYKISLFFHKHLGENQTPPFPNDRLHFYCTRLYRLPLVEKSLYFFAKCETLHLSLYNLSFTKSYGQKLRNTPTKARQSESTLLH